MCEVIHLHLLGDGIRKHLVLVQHNGIALDDLESPMAEMLNYWLDIIVDGASVLRQNHVVAQ
eukprot:8450860-Prorocentrum_lima.AAC.1